MQALAFVCSTFKTLALLAQTAVKVADGFSGRGMKPLGNKMDNSCGLFAFDLVKGPRTRLTLGAKWRPMPDDKDAHLAAGLVPDLCGIGSRDRDDPEGGKCHVAE